uniref:Discoidin, CUB and LCCL domain-containing protein 2-like n=1 Tax=Petromyzon marinus TaxID=7757 RepID=A0AAJ7U2K5_PETMA|nr:discoidin, CUB and LCCL domain-containing protein 2-like [Petromyzon marinus]
MRRRAVETAAAGSLLWLLVAALIRSGVPQKGDGCGHSVLGALSGTLSSLGYPAASPAHAVCVWELRVPPGRRIRLRFADLQVLAPEPFHCQENHVKIYSGISNWSEMGTFCGELDKVKQELVSESNEVTVRFQSGSHEPGRGFLLSYAIDDHADLITCLESGADFADHEFTRFCPAGCLTPFGDVSGTIPNGYRDSSPVCRAAVHAGVIAPDRGGVVSVVQSKGRASYESRLANNVTSLQGSDSPNLFTFKTTGCYGKLGMESGTIRDSQLSASSVLAQLGKDGVVMALTLSSARLGYAGPAWVARLADPPHWLQIDLNKERRVTGIVTAGSGGPPNPSYFVSAYKVQWSLDGAAWSTYKNNIGGTDKLFQGNVDSLSPVRNNFVPALVTRLVRVCPIAWHQKIAMKLELLGCELPTTAAAAGTLRPRAMRPVGASPPGGTEWPPGRGAEVGATTVTAVKNSTMPGGTQRELVLVSTLVPVCVVLVAVLLVLSFICAKRRRDRGRKDAGPAYSLPCTPGQSGWFKGLKQVFPRQGEGRGRGGGGGGGGLHGTDSSLNVRYSSDAHRGPAARKHSVPEYQPLVLGGSELARAGKASTFRPTRDYEEPEQSPGGGGGGSGGLPLPPPPLTLPPVPAAPVPGAPPSPSSSVATSPSPAAYDTIGAYDDSPARYASPLSSPAAPALHLYAEPVPAQVPEYAMPIGFTLDPVRAFPVAYDTPRSPRRAEQAPARPNFSQSASAIGGASGDGGTVYDTPRAVRRNATRGNVGAGDAGGVEGGGS